MPSTRDTDHQADDRVYSGIFRADLLYNRT
jgi:hypothetical protein